MSNFYISVKGWLLATAPNATYYGYPIPFDGRPRAVDLVQQSNGINSVMWLDGVAVGVILDASKTTVSPYVDFFREGTMIRGYAGMYGTVPARGPIPWGLRRGLNLSHIPGYGDYRGMTSDPDVAPEYVFAQAFLSAAAAKKPDCTACGRLDSWHARNHASGVCADCYDSGRQYR